jgi:hypothetical protein
MIPPFARSSFGRDLPAVPSDWPLAAWDHYREATAKHKAEGLTEEEAMATAEAEVRRWWSTGGEEWIRGRGDK